MDVAKLSDVILIASTICAEAGGEPYAGKVMVGDVIANRAKQSGKSLRDVCRAPKQFSCWSNRGTMELRMQTMRKHPAWNDCLRIAESICQPGYRPASPATHYFNPELANPDWAPQLRRVAIVGKHWFFC